MPQEWKEFIFVAVHKKRNKMYCNHFRGMSLLAISYKILSNIFLARMTPDANIIIEEYKCGFIRNRSTLNHIFSIEKIFGMKWEYKSKTC